MKSISYSIFSVSGAAVLYLGAAFSHQPVPTVESVAPEGSKLMASSISENVDTVSSSSKNADTYVSNNL